jgi:hypothetical protein
MSMSCWEHSTQSRNYNINSNSCWLFSREAESVTYAGDKLKYDFLDNIYDENSNQIGTRNGFILSRENLDGLSINKDWENKNIEDIN